MFETMEDRITFNAGWSFRESILSGRGICDDWGWELSGRYNRFLKWRHETGGADPFEMLRIELLNGIDGILIR